MILSKAELDAIDKLHDFCKEYGYRAAGTLDHKHIHLGSNFNRGDSYILPLDGIDYFLAQMMPEKTADPTISFEELYEHE